MAIRNIAIACQGGGSHAAYSAGVLQQLLPALDEKNQDLRLVGISGTSGGAICALLAWYGWLVDGAETAARKLETFWQSNCALLPGERLWNESLVGTMGAISCDIKFSPYDWPLREEEEIATRWWPVAARMMGDGNLWMRGDFFQLSELVRPHVDFDLVQALGDFCSIPFEIKQWLSADFQAGLLAGNEACREHFDRIKSHLQNNIGNGLAAPAKIHKMMDAANVRADAPRRRAL